ncbi:hypothetical protein H0X10_04565 [Candidatus Saccharibacteria bacterium]|nr:hypothetical protein [Candidatus Saccharibacteria bacterium]
MKKFKLINKPTRVSDVMSFEDLYEEISSNWELKAERFLRRKEQEFKRAL